MGSMMDIPAQSLAMLAATANPAKDDLERRNAELEALLASRTAELQAVRRELETFSSAVAHDLRAPLAVIGGYSQMIDEAEGGRLSSRCGHYLRRIRAAAEQMSDMTEGLLTLARVARTTVRREPIDLAALAREVVARLRDGDGGRSMHVEMEGPLPARGDRVLLKLALEHLLGNAWKFTGGRTEARIRVGMVRTVEGQAAYFVQDDGVGFDMTHAARLFGAFERLHSADEFEGTGIGLAVVRKVVEMHGGRTWADAKPARGTTIFFTLD
jgi:signal transduction histidine kinase